MKFFSKIKLILKAVQLTILGYRAEATRNKIKKHYYKKGVNDNTTYLQKLLDKYNYEMNKWNELDLSYVKLRNSLIF